MPGYTAPIVKTEVAEVEEEAADYGAPEEETGKPEGAPTRAMPDYGDLLDDDEPSLVQGGVKASKEEDGQNGEASPPRKEAIYIAGVQRLTRTHLAEIFQSKDLPVFKWIEWLDDERCLCVFDQAANAAIALRGCLAGFQDISDDRPGPGLWRAQRCMLDFREATQGDRPAEDFKRQHRGGKQVREYRFWECMKDMDKFILGDEDEPAQGVKRSAPSGEDAIAAADWDDDRQRRKRLRRGLRPSEQEEEDIDLLNRMAQQDQNILTKEEAGESTSLPTTNAGPVAEVDADDDDRAPREKGSADWWGAEGDQWSGEKNDLWGSWGGGGGGGAWDSNDWSRAPRRRRQDDWGRNQGQRGDQRPRNNQPAGGAAKSKSSVAGDFSVPMDEAEKDKRSRRGDRFKVSQMVERALSMREAPGSSDPPTQPKQEV